MNVAVINCDDYKNAAGEDPAQMTIKWLEGCWGMHQLHTTTIDYKQGPREASWDSFDVVVITGSRADAYDTSKEWINSLRDLIAQRLHSRIPIVGICFGAQIVSHALGVPVGNGAWELSMRAHALTDAGRLWLPAAVDGHLRLFQVHQDHIDSTQTPPGYEVLSRSTMGVQMALVDNKSLLVQGHPEFEAEFVATKLHRVTGEYLQDCQEHLHDKGCSADMLGRRIYTWLMEMKSQPVIETQGKAKNKKGSPDLLGKAIALVGEAIEEDQKGNLKGAFALYMNSFAWFELALKYERNPAARQKVEAKMKEYIRRAEYIKSAMGGQPVSGPKVKREKDSAVLSPEEEMALRKEGMKRTLVTEKSDRVHSFEDLAGLEQAKQVMAETFLMPLKFPHLFSQSAAAGSSCTPWRSVLLYSPPGYGKHLLLDATFAQLPDSLSIYRVSSGDILSRWLGESELNLRALFQLAGGSVPSVIVFDEMSSFLVDSTSNDTMVRVHSEFCLQMRDCPAGVTVVACTSRPWLLKCDLLSRFERVVAAEAPDAQEALLRMGVSEECAHAMAPRCGRYSPSDLHSLVRQAQMQARMQDAPHCSMQHYMSALANTVRSVTDDDLQQFQQWTSEHQ